MAHALPALPYLKIFPIKNSSKNLVAVYFRDPLTKTDRVFESLKDHPVHVASGRFPDTFYGEYARLILDVTERRITALLNGTLPKGATGVLEMATMGGMGKEELARMIQRIVVKEDAS